MIFSINMITILMMSAKLATLGFLKKKLFWNKAYDAMISVYDVNNKKFGNSSPSMTEVIVTSIYKDLTRKTTFLWGGLGSSSIICDWH